MEAATEVGSIFCGTAQMLVCDDECMHQIDIIRSEELVLVLAGEPSSELMARIMEETARIEEGNRIIAAVMVVLRSRSLVNE